jgi:hypothetical protein
MEKDIFANTHQKNVEAVLTQTEQGKLPETAKG